ncbi:hypothetical protein H2202_011147 [Exophiala xenobiotica]|nr:hypothetical protein H2202_011147 [Exophiala xenobiotica]
MPISWSSNKPGDKDKWEKNGGFSGHVNEDMIKHKLFEPGQKSVVFLCGPPAMIQKAALPALKGELLRICGPKSEALIIAQIGDMKKMRTALDSDASHNALVMDNRHGSVRCRVGVYGSTSLDRSKYTAADGCQYAMVLTFTNAQKLAFRCLWFA